MSEFSRSPVRPVDPGAPSGGAASLAQSRDREGQDCIGGGLPGGPVTSAELYPIWVAGAKDCLVPCGIDIATMPSLSVQGLDAINRAIAYVKRTFKVCFEVPACDGRASERLISPRWG